MDRIPQHAGYHNRRGNLSMKPSLRHLPPTTKRSGADSLSVAKHSPHLSTRASEIRKSPYDYGFEHQLAVLHEKSVVADGFVTIIGSSNLDFRSFQFNAECNVMRFDGATAQHITVAFEADLQHSVEIRHETWARRSVLHRFGDAMARHLSPLL